MSDRVIGAQGSSMSDGNEGFRNWTLEQWKKVVWSDESHFLLLYLGGPVLFIYISRRYNQAILDNLRPVFVSIFCMYIRQ